MEMTLNQKVERAKALIKQYAEKYPNADDLTTQHAFAFSGGKDSAVLQHIAYKAIGDQPRLFAVLSDTEFPETEDYVAGQMNINIFRYQNSGNPADCCRSAKVDAFKKAVKSLDVWFSGIRADEGATRNEVQEVEERVGLIKVNPLLHFTEKDIWRYIAINGIPINSKYKDGYRSLSCSKCSVVEQGGDEPERAGRWKGQTCEAGECGIHSQSLRA